MRLVSSLCTGILLLCLQTQLTGQWRDQQLSRLGPSEGLPAYVNDMVQDSTGFIYFGTNIGLYRYDGHDFNLFGHDPTDSTTIGAGDISEMLLGRDGQIWITLRFGGLNSFDPLTGKFRHYPLPPLKFRSLPTAHGLYEDDDDILWVGGAHFRLLAFDRNTHTYTSYTPEWIQPEEHGGRLTILSIVPDPGDADILWLSVLDYQPEALERGSYGLVTFNKKTHAFTSHNCFGQTQFIDKDGVLWGTYWGNLITSYDPVRQDCETYYFECKDLGITIGGVSHDMIQREDDLLVSTSKALLKFNDGHFDAIQIAQKADEQYISLFTDRDANTWVGTNQGALIMNPAEQHIRFFSLSTFGTSARLFPGRLAFDAPANTVYLVHTSDNLSKRIYRIPLDEDKKDEADFVTTPFQVYGIATDHRNRLWISGDGGLYEADRQTGKPIRKMRTEDGQSIPYILNLKSGRDGWLGAAGFDEFLWMHSDSQVVHRIAVRDLPGSEYAKSFDNALDGITLGTHNRAYLFCNEVFMIDLLTGHATQLHFDPVLNPYIQRVQYVGEDPDGFIWISTFEALARCGLSGDSLTIVDLFTLNDGMVSPIAQELHVDDSGRVWAFTSSGINCIDPVTREVRTFGSKAGLPNPFIDPRQVITVSEGRIATVNDNGLIVFQPDSLWNSVTPSQQPVIIKNIRVNGEPYAASGESVHTLGQLYLPPGQASVDIEFQGLVFPTDYLTEYSYRISGIQENWISIGTNKLVTLPALSPGNYTFEVKVGNTLSKAPVKTLAIHVATPFYQRAWFIILVLALLIGIIGGLMQWRIRTIRRKEEDRSEVSRKIAELELKALRSQMNPHFMFNSLNSIKNYILHAKPDLAAEYLSNFSHLIRMILQNSREKTISLQEELETLRLYIELERLRFDEEFDFNCSVDSALRMEHIQIPPMLLQPYVENAIWHGLMHKKEPGHLMLSFNRENGMVACIIEDDGVGRARANDMKSLSAVKYKSMGMGINQDRIDIMNKMDALGITTEVVDKYDADGNATGTRITVRIPATNGYL